MNPSNFDELTKALAASTSRRHALRLIATASVGALLGLGGVSTAFAGHRRKSRRTRSSPSRTPKPNRDCAKWCAQVFGPNTPAASQCTSDAAHNKGPCKTCGSFSPSDICCTKSNPPSGPCTGGIVAGCICSGCGTCNYSNGTCPASCPGGQNCCGGSCKDLSNDATNCGACGTVCASDETCCSGQCKNTNTDSNNCGGCGAVCPPDHACVPDPRHSFPICCPNSFVCGNGSLCCDTINTTCCGGTVCCAITNCIGDVCTS
jgi:hypothetical protein